VVTQPAYVRNLKAYVKIRAGGAYTPTEAVDAVFAESDRGAAILTATGVEDTLEWACARKMKLKPEALDAVFGFDGLAGTFSAKIHLAFALGIIDRETHDQIDLLREIRNACAHSRKPINFELPELKAITLVAIKDLTPILQLQQPGALRDGFVLTCNYVEQCIIKGRRVPAVRFLAAMQREVRRRASPNKPHPRSSRGGLR
jgi:hypothetical protein